MNNYKYIYFRIHFLLFHFFFLIFFKFLNFPVWRNIRLIKKPMSCEITTNSRLCVTIFFEAYTRKRAPNFISIKLDDMFSVSLFFSQFCLSKFPLLSSSLIWNVKKICTANAHRKDISWAVIDRCLDSNYVRFVFIFFYLTERMSGQGLINWLYIT